jgi:DNA replication protein DnaC
VPLDDPNYGHVYPCECTAGRLQEVRRRKLLDESGLGALQRMTFDNFLPNTEAEDTEVAAERMGISRDDVISLTLARLEVEEYAEQRWPQGWLLLAGTYGCGKTHLAAAAVNLRITKGWPACFVVVPDFLDHLRSAFGPNAQTDYDGYFERVKLSEFLVLDDLGAEYATSWADEKLYQLINYRYNAQLPTMFTTNAKGEDIEPRIRSRIFDKQFTILRAITAPDYRLNSPGEYQGNAFPVAAVTAPAPARRGRRKA